MKILPTDIPDILLLEPRVFADARGFFLESYNQKTLAALGIPAEFVQDNHSRSMRGVLRGLHYQVNQPQGKLVRVVQGEVYDVAVDLRRRSSTFRQWVGARLSSENKQMLWVPPGFGHGFLVLSEAAEVLYKTTDYYAPEHERCIVWNDADIGIDWPLSQVPILSARDRAGQSLREAELFA